MRIAILRDPRGQDAATPDMAASLTRLGLEVVLESGAGQDLPDRIFAEGGARIAPTPEAALTDADWVLRCGAAEAALPGSPASRSCLIVAGIWYTVFLMEGRHTAADVSKGTDP